MRLLDGRLWKHRAARLEQTLELFGRVGRGDGEQIAQIVQPHDEVLAALWPACAADLRHVAVAFGCFLGFVQLLLECGDLLPQRIGARCLSQYRYR